MLNNQTFFSTLDNIAPLSLSHKLIENGDYDNSGFLIKSHEGIEKALFTLDLTEKSVLVAKRLKCDTIVTHHPVIYNPISNLSVDGENSAVLLAIKNNFNVISMHLNLDVCSGGIDASLAKALGAKTYRILDALDEKCGYGREFSLEGITFEEFIKRAKKNLKTSKVTVYGKRSSILNMGASFCGAGSSIAEQVVIKGQTEADVIVTSDMKHNVIVSLLERGKNILIVPHYASENYGFRIFYNNVNEVLNGKVKTEFFEDKRFL